LHSGFLTPDSWILIPGAADTRPDVTLPIFGFWMDGAFTKRSVQFG